MAAFQEMPSRGVSLQSRTLKLCGLDANAMIEAWPSAILIYSLLVSDSFSSHF